MKTEHTQGPWKARSKDQCVYGPAGVTICYCGDNGIYGYESYSISKTESYGNARLIAAAPGMLEALKEILTISEVKYQRSYEDWIETIEKATGKTWSEIKEAGE